MIPVFILCTLVLLLLLVIAFMLWRLFGNVTLAVKNNIEQATNIILELERIGCSCSYRAKDCRRRKEAWRSSTRRSAESRSVSLREGSRIPEDNFVVRCLSSAPSSLSLGDGSSIIRLIGVISSAASLPHKSGGGIHANS